MSRNLERERKRRALKVLARKRRARKRRYPIGAGTPNQSAGSTDDAVFGSDLY